MKNRVLESLEKSKEMNNINGEKLDFMKNILKETKNKHKRSLELRDQINDFQSRLKELQSERLAIDKELRYLFGVL